MRHVLVPQEVSTTFVVAVSYVRVIDLYVVVAHEDGFCVVTAIDYGRENYGQGYHMYYREGDLFGPGQHDVLGYFAVL